jgi:hypothetical protein
LGSSVGEASEHVKFVGDLALGANLFGTAPSEVDRQQKPSDTDRSTNPIDPEAGTSTGASTTTTGYVGCGVETAASGVTLGIGVGVGLGVVTLAR